MKLLLTVATAAFLVSGCGSNDNKFVKMGKKYEKNMCACKDAKCVTDVEAARRADRKKNRPKKGEMPDISKSDIEKLMKLKASYKKCQAATLKEHGKKHPRVLAWKTVADNVCNCKKMKCVKKARKKIEDDKTDWLLRKFISKHRKRIRKCRAKIRTAKSAD